MTSHTVISPHLDDGLFGLGGLLAQYPGSVVVTVYGGIPSTAIGLTPFDAKCGFPSSKNAVLERRYEDVMALNEIGCGAVHLPFLDGQYGPMDDVQSSGFVECLMEIMRDSEQTVWCPLGLVHPDHVAVARACRSAAAAVERDSLLVYADLPSAVLYPKDRRPAKDLWARSGWSFARVPWVPDLDAKRRAVAHYKSQMGLPELTFENLVEERGWRATYDG